MALISSGDISSTRLLCRVHRNKMYYEKMVGLDMKGRVLHEEDVIFK